MYDGGLEARAGVAEPRAAAEGQARRAARDALKRIRDEGIRFVDLKFVDLFGVLQHITFAADVIDEDTFEKGLGFDGSSVRGFQKIHESDMVLVPDPGSAFVDPFFDEPTLCFFCDITDPSTWRTYTRDTRAVGHRAERHLRESGIADTAYFGPELEFYVFDDVRYDCASQHAYHFVDSAAAFWNSGEEQGPNLGHIPQRKGNYFAAAPMDRLQNLRSKMVSVMRGVGIPAELHHAEVGAAGQSELGWRFSTLVEQADRAVKYKYVVKNVAQRFGKTATFMPKPLFLDNGSGMHVHVSLWKHGRNLFFEKGGYADLSRMAHHFIGGLLDHAPALCGLVAPTTNSYRRLVPGYEAPMNLVFSQRNRSACIRIPMFATSPKAKRLEFRTPDPSGNPYLTMAAILMAGLDGIERKLDPPPPIDEDIYELAEHGEADHVKSTPGSLDASLDALEADHAFLLRGGVFTEDLVRMWIDWQREHEIDFIRLRPHPGEFALYYNV